MSRLDQERQDKLEPKRINETRDKLVDLGYTIVDLNDISYMIVLPCDGRTVLFWPYSGWWSGKGIGSGRGFKKLLKALKGKI